MCQTWTQIRSMTLNVSFWELNCRCVYIVAGISRQTQKVISSLRWQHTLPAVFLGRSSRDSWQNQKSVSSLLTLWRADTLLFGFCLSLGLVNHMRCPALHLWWDISARDISTRDFSAPDISARDVCSSRYPKNYHAPFVTIIVKRSFQRPKSNSGFFTITAAKNAVTSKACRLYP